MTDTIYTTNEMPYPYYGQKCYRIEIKQSAHGWFQRHIWTDADGDVRAERWIPSSVSEPGDAYRKIPRVASDAMLVGELA